MQPKRGVGALWLVLFLEMIQFPPILVTVCNCLLEITLVLIIACRLVLLLAMLTGFKKLLLRTELSYK